MTTNTPNEVFLADAVPSRDSVDSAAGSNASTTNITTTTTSTATNTVTTTCTAITAAGHNEITIAVKPPKRRPPPVNAVAASSIAAAAALSPSFSSATETPMYPPSPMIDHLTPDEIEALNDVFSRMEQFDEEETQRIRQELLLLFINF